MKLLENLSIKKLTTLIFSIMYVIFFLITTFSLYSYSIYESQKTEKIIKNFNSTLSSQIVEKLDNIYNVSKYPLLLPDINKLHSTLSDNKNYTIEDLNFLTKVCDMMLIQNDSINGAYIFNTNGNGTFSIRNLNNSKLKNVLQEEWFTKAINNDSQTTLIPYISQENIFNDNNLDNEPSIGFTRKIIDIQTKRTTGVVLLTLPISNIKGLISSYLPYNNQIISLYDNNEDLIISTEENNLIKSPTESSMNTLSYKPNLKEINKDYVAAFNAVESTNWILISLIPKTSAYHLNSLYLIFFIINIVFFSILFFILYLFFNKRIFNPLKSLITNMDKNVENNLNYSFKYSANDEIGSLVKSYNEMKIRINDLININYKSKIEQKELELRQLQNQINPHFIYNTLESIHMMAEINDDLETSTMAEYFGSIMRYSMNKRCDIVSLREEIKIIHNYIYLQKIRFEQLFTIESFIDEEVMDCKIIKMIIQPVIENSINHGLSKCTEAGKIIIEGRHIENKLILDISDNGIGMTKETLQDLTDYINDKNEKFTGIALKNINKRLKLNYGEEYGLQIFSTINKGTNVLLTLPYKKE